MKRSLSLSRRLFYSHLFCALSIAFAVASYLYWAISSDLIAATQHHLREVIAEIEVISKTIDFSKEFDPEAPTNIEPLRTKLLVAREHEELNAIAIWLGDKRIVSVGDLGQGADQAPLIKAQVSTHDNQTLDISIRANTSAQDARLAEIRVYSLLGFIGAVLLSLLFARVLSKRIDRKLEDLVQRLQQVAAGRFEARMHAVSDDHFGRLALAFNDMSERLQRTLGERERSLEQLRQARDRLEIAMRERTKELSDLNDMLRQEHEQRAQLEASLAEAAATDAQTKLLNRRSMLALFQQVERVMRKSSKNCCIALLDIDHFKQVNDRFGHDVGDEVLIGLSEIIRRHMRADEAAARWGGEEFILAWPDQPLNVAQQRANRLRELINEQSFAGGKLRITASIGIALWVADETLEVALKRADTALYRAKSEGRNRVVLETNA